MGQLLSSLLTLLFFLSGPALKGNIEIWHSPLAAKTAATLADDLAAAASRAGNTVGPGRGPVYGTQVHSAFANEVRAFGNPNVRSEVSFLNGRIVDYGTPGSVRLDAVQFGPNNQVLSVFDLKTGSATLTPQRILQIQQQVGSPVPVNLLRP
jgi:hypothetical protein